MPAYVAFVLCFSQLCPYDARDDARDFVAAHTALS